MHERSSINCLHADAAKFSHPLQHLGKTTADLPLLAIDSFRHMFIFPDIKQISVNGKLLQFIKDLHSGKLHQDFHNPPPPSAHIIPQENVDIKSQGTINDGSPGQAANQFLKLNNAPSPPESVFIRLTPSRQRYSFRDEL